MLKIEFFIVLLTELWWHSSHCDFAHLDIANFLVFFHFIPVWCWVKLCWLLSHCYHVQGCLIKMHSLRTYVSVPSSIQIKTQLIILLEFLWMGTFLITNCSFALKLRWKCSSSEHRLPLRPFGEIAKWKGCNNKACRMQTAKLDQSVTGGFQKNPQNEATS